MPFVTQVVVGRLPELQVFGGDYPTPDGSGVRGYIHVMDLAEGHQAALDWALRDPSLARQRLGWTAQRTLEDMCRDAWNWQRKNPRGFA